MKILITAGNSSTAFKVMKSFAGEIVLADYGEVPSMASASYKLISMGPKNEDILAHTLLNNCLDEGAEMILPLHFFELESVAKASLLFDEFGIAVLLPNLNVISSYLSSAGVKSDNWIVLKNGELIFTSIPLENPLVVTEKYKDLSGAFYLTSENGDPKLSLITV